MKTYSLAAVHDSRHETLSVIDMLGQFSIEHSDRILGQVFVDS